MERWKMLRRYVIARDKDGNDMAKEYQIPQIQSTTDAIEYLGESYALKILEKGVNEDCRARAMHQLKTILG